MSLKYGKGCLSLGELFKRLWEGTVGNSPLSYRIEASENTLRKKNYQKGGGEVSLLGKLKKKKGRLRGITETKIQNTHECNKGGYGW